MHIGGSIILIEITKGKGKTVREAWGSLTETCRIHNLPYNFIRREEFPITYENKDTGTKYVLERLKFRTKVS